MAVGWAAAEALGYRKDSKAFRPLVNLLKTVVPLEQPSTVGEHAALALGYLEQRPAVTPLREAAHRLGDWNTTERLSIAFALCRLRPDDEYNFWLLRKALKGELARAPYRAGEYGEYLTAARLFVQLDDKRVRETLIEASQAADATRAEPLLAGFAALGLEPGWDGTQYVLRDVPPERAPSHPPHQIVPPWPFSDARPPRRLEMEDQ